MIKLQGTTKKIEEKSPKKFFLKISKMEFVGKRNGKEKEKYLPDPVKPESKSSKESKGTFNLDVKSQNTEILINL